MIFPIPLSTKHLSEAIESHTIFDDPKVVPHLAKILDLVKKDNPSNLDLVQLSNVIKQTKVNHDERNAERKQKVWFSAKEEKQMKKYNFQVRNFVKEADKLRTAGISLGESVHEQVQKELIRVAEQKKLNECRFWGKILGTQSDYYVIQGYRQTPKQHVSITLGSQKPGQGVNYHTYFVTNDIFHPKWQQLPFISVQQVRTARNIKRLFTGNLNATIISYPAFPGLEKHYLKAQLARMTHSLQLSPKGIYKVNDDNPKVIEYQEEVKVPDFSQLATLEGWVHTNQNILNLGRCTHFVDPSLPEDQLQAAASELAEKDPEVQRLRGITQDKPTQVVQGGLQSFWILKTLGNSQTFPKEDSQSIYAVSTLRNTLWPGWVTIGFMGGYSNFYIGNGLKASQPAWSTLSNQNLQPQGEDKTQYPQPNPKQLPKIQVAIQQNEQNAEDSG